MGTWICLKDLGMDTVRTQEGWEQGQGWTVDTQIHLRDVCGMDSR